MEPSARRRVQESRDGEDRDRGSGCVPRQPCKWRVVLQLKVVQVWARLSTWSRRRPRRWWRPGSRGVRVRPRQGCRRVRCRRAAVRRALEPRCWRRACRGVRCVPRPGRVPTAFSDVGPTSDRVAPLTPMMDAERINVSISHSLTLRRAGGSRWRQLLIPLFP